MKLRPLITPALVLTTASGLLAWLLFVDPPSQQEEPVAAGSVTKSAQEASGPEKTIETAPQASQSRTQPSTQSEPVVIAAAPLPDAIRNVSPEGVSAPKVQGDLKRIEPSKRYLELKNPPIEPVPDGPLEFMRVQVLDGGHLKSDRLTVTLAHIIPLKSDETCISRLGGTWPCGARARTFLRGLVRQLKVTCEKIEETGPQQILATCTRGSMDLSRRLVRYGWADPAPGAPADLADLARKAKDGKIGKWQSEWLNELPTSELDTEVPSALPGLEELAPEIIEWSLRSEPEQPGEGSLAVEDYPQADRPVR
ncbi:thermonuclease family protein [Roseibium sp. LAB1]